MKCSIFIDGNNFYDGLRNLYGKDKSLKKFNMQGFITFLSQDNEVADIFYYNARLDKKVNPEKYKSQEDFFKEICKIKKLKLVLCRLLKRKVKNTNQEYYVLKEDDLHMAVDIVEGACDNKYDLAIIVSGDGDFVPAVVAVRRRGKKVKNIYFKCSSSRNLKNYSDSSLELNRFLLDQFFT